MLIGHSLIVIICNCKYIHYSNILAGFSYLNMLQCNLIYDRYGSFLNLVFSNVKNVNVSQVTCPLVPLDRMYYPVLSIKISSVSVLVYLDYKDQIYNFKSRDYNTIRSSIELIDWNGLLKNLNTNEAAYIFYENIFKIID